MRVVRVNQIVKLGATKTNALKCANDTTQLRGTLVDHFLQETPFTLPIVILIIFAIKRLISLKEISHGSPVLCLKHKSLELQN